MNSTKILRVHLVSASHLVLRCFQWITNREWLRWLAHPGPLPRGEGEQSRVAGKVVQPTCRRRVGVRASEHFTILNANFTENSEKPTAS